MHTQPLAMVELQSSDQSVLNRNALAELSTHRSTGILQHKAKTDQRRDLVVYMLGHDSRVCDRRRLEDRRIQTVTMHKNENGRATVDFSILGTVGFYANSRRG
jgi:hypothetical protein